ncbi:MAG: DJ-1/PfpI family protein [Verrucomicrobiae bacterium]|nr:DJ-1/PfpI family protein [Verrucomicrobiae bacterium]
MKHILIALLLCSTLALTFPVQGAGSAPGKVLFVVAHKDFYFQEYEDPRRALETAGYQTVVTSTQGQCVPHANSGQGDHDGILKTDVLLKDAKAADYRAVVIVGGWGASMFQPAFTGKYQNGEYNLSEADRKAFNDLIAAFVAEDKIVSAICHGSASLAWCRVGGVSPLKGRKVVGYQGGGPGYTLAGKDFADNQQPTRWHITENGGNWLPANSVGDPSTDADDVVVDGRIVTAQNYNSARRFGEELVAVLQKSGK